MESPTLTFSALDAQIQALPELPADKAIFPKQAKWGFCATAVGALLGLLSSKLLPTDSVHTMVITGTCLIVEIAGVVATCIALVPKKWPTFANECRDFAKELDFDLPHHLAIIEWLQTFPLDQRETLRAFVSYRHERMLEKLPMLTGSIEKLGALPILIALYLQFNDMQWPPHPSWLKIFLIFALVLGYGLSVRQIRIRLRLQLYETLLSKATA